jgi:thymidylate synthase (FAD)
MIEVKLIDKMGTDLSVVNAARVSFANKHKEFDKDRDERLIKFLAKHNHWSPFAHCSMQFHIRAPIFVARQLVKHQVGLSWNEVSRRYVDKEPEFYEPNMWRQRNPDKKQGSLMTPVKNADIVERTVDNYNDIVRTIYNNLLEHEVAPEQARMILPQSMMTEWYWSGTLYAFARVCNLRTSSDAQYETRSVAHDISKQAKDSFPVCWKHLTEEVHGNSGN